MSALRSLPPRPSLEFEHKEAKELLRRLRAGDPDSLARARARHLAIASTPPARIRLADAQLVIAREYGFASWPRLVRYFEDLDRQRHAQRTIHTREFYEGLARSRLVEHRERRTFAARALAAYVPRFYGMQIEDVFASDVAEADARLAVAREFGFPNWEVLLERCADQAGRRRDDWTVDPMRYASQAMEAADVRALERVVDEHPELFHPTEYEVAKGRRLLATALAHERKLGRDRMRPIVEWLQAQGLDLQLELNSQLCGHMYFETEKVRWLLDRGADPNWIAPNGIPVIEHALIRYWNGEAVDVLAARARPRDALWIAAGLGDVAGVRRFLDRHGRPTAATRRLRPDFDAVGPSSIAAHPNATDEEILMEAFAIAMFNGRTQVLEYMASRGTPLDSLVFGSPVILVAVGNGWVPVVESLVRSGANLDLRGWRPNQSARELAREMLENVSQDDKRRRIAELCGMDSNAILAERDARTPGPPPIAPELQEALELASDDAVRRGQTEVVPENLLFGLLRAGGLPLLYLTQVSKIDLDRFRVDVRDRVRPADDRIPAEVLPMHGEARAALNAAIAIAGERRRDAAKGLHLLYSLTRAGTGFAAELLKRYGASVSELNAAIERAL